uniref:Actin-related protein 10 n=1 Tax=Panagrellus redivivus TaxID=6233 RepID=A0A7E4V1G5_PANRE
MSRRNESIINVPLPASPGQREARVAPSVSNPSTSNPALHRLYNPAALQTKSPAYSQFSSKELEVTYVIEIGARWTRYGLANSYYPREIVSSFYPHPKDQKLCHVLDHTLSETDHSILLNAFLTKYCTMRLSNAAMDKRIVIVEGLFVHEKARKRLAKCFFERQSVKASAIVYAPAPLMHIVPFGTDTAIVVDIGYNYVAVTPVWDNVIFFSACTYNLFGSKHLLERIRDHYKTKGLIRTFDGTIRPFNDEDMKRFDEWNTAEDLLSRFFFVTRSDRAKSYQKATTDGDEEITYCPDVESYFYTEKLIVPGSLREFTAELLFDGVDYSDVYSIPELIYKAVALSPVDIRRSLLSNIIVTGGAACLRGIHGRIDVELKYLIMTGNGGLSMKLMENVGFLKVPGGEQIERYSAWLGGCLCGGIIETRPRYYSLKHWEEGVPLPDWTTQIDNYRIPVCPDKVVTENVTKQLVGLRVV